MPEFREVWQIASFTIIYFISLWGDYTSLPC